MAIVTFPSMQVMIIRICHEKIFIIYQFKSNQFNLIQFIIQSIQPYMWLWTGQT